MSSNTNKSLFLLSRQIMLPVAMHKKIQPSHCRVDVRKYFFAHKVIGPWNSLPANNEHFKSLSSFKAFLKHVDLIKFMACT